MRLLAYDRLCALADGVATLFTRHGRWNGLDGPDREEPEKPFQQELAI